MKHDDIAGLFIGLHKPEVIDRVMTVHLIKGRPSSSAQCYKLSYNEGMQTLYAHEVDNPNKLQST